MNTLHSSLRLVVCTSILLAALPGRSAEPEQHDAHHPANVQATAKSPTKAQAAPSDQMMKMDAHMKAMQDMHDKMMKAKTPEERQKLIAEHMKTMRDGMSMMKDGMMRGASGKAAMSPQTMQQRMDMMQKQMEMMQTMMHMMMDRMEKP